MKKLFLFLAVAAMSLTSCSNDDDSSPVSSSREIKYEITGDYSGTEPLDITYFENGQASITEATSLPWTRTYTADDDTLVGGFNVGGIGATPGEVITLKVYQGDTLLESVDATATSEGIFVGTVNATFN